MLPQDQLGDRIATGRRRETVDGSIDVVSGRNVTVVAHDNRDIGVCHAILERGILDQRILDQRILDERILDEGVLDEGILNQRVLDERVLEAVVFN